MQPHIVQKPSDNVGVSVSTISTSLPAPQSNVVSGIVVIESADVRMRWDGTAPVGGVGGGLLMAKDSVWEIVGRDYFIDMRFIRDASDDAYVSVAYSSGG